MNDQYFGEGLNHSAIVERTDQVPNSPVDHPDLFADRVPVDAAQIHETPMGGTLAAVSPMNETPAAEIPMFETPAQEIPMGGAVAAVNPMNETIVDEVPAIETIPYQAAVVETIPYQAPVVETITHETPVGTSAGSSPALLTREESEHFRTRWNEIQGKFVDEPRTAVQQADTLVSEVIGQITQMFANEHSSLEGQWKQGNDVSTEDLRQALRRYRSFFNRLVV